MSLRYTLVSLLMQPLICQKISETRIIIKGNKANEISRIKKSLGGFSISLKAVSSMRQSIENILSGNAAIKA